MVGPQGPTGVAGSRGPPRTQGKDEPKGEGQVGPKANNRPHGLHGHAGVRGRRSDMGERGLKSDLRPLTPKGETGERGDMHCT